ncbi:unnamed protein product [Symbiodinium natans]|uniref:Uncharacterized protein n=1 Tax=Symbiodinium natans TaxID=878477 RepID=A0A812HD51_9DINO|nr:unnamed protein product [Symbiodinium natans]
MKSKIDKKATRSIAALGQALFTRCPFDHPEGRNKENLGQLLHHKTLPTLASRGIEDRKAQSSGACATAAQCRGDTQFAPEVLSYFRSLPKQQGIDQALACLLRLGSLSKRSAVQDANGCDLVVPKSLERFGIFKSLGGSSFQDKYRRAEFKAKGAGLLGQDSAIEGLLDFMLQHQQAPPADVPRLSLGAACAGECHDSQALRGPRALGAALVALARLRGGARAQARVVHRSRWCHEAPCAVPVGAPVRIEELRRRCLARAASQTGAGPRAAGLQSGGERSLMVAAQSILKIRTDSSAKDLANMAWAAATLSEQGKRQQWNASSSICNAHPVLFSPFSPARENCLAAIHGLVAPRTCAAVLRHVAREALIGRPASLKSGFQPLDLVWAQLCWSMGTLREAPMPLSEALFSAAEQRHAELAPQGWANVAWACARLCSRGPRAAVNCALQMVTAAGRALRSDPEVFAAQNMSNLAWAAGTLAIDDDPFFTSLAAACRVCELRPQHVANIAWSFGAVANRNDQFMHLLSERALDIGLASFQSEELAGFLWALGTLGSAPPVLSAALPEVHRRAWQLGATELSGVIWALAALGQDSAAFATATHVAENRATELSPQGLANVFWAFATLEVPWEFGVSAPRLSSAAHARCQELTPQGLANLAWALVVLTAAEAISESAEVSALHAVLNRAPTVVGSLKTLELAALAWVAARCGSYVSVPSSLEAALATEVLRRLAHAEDFEPRQLSNFAWAFATMASRATLIEALGQEALPRLESFSSQGLSNMTWALGCTTAFTQGIGESLLRGLAAAAAPRRSFTPQGLALLAWAIAPESRMRMDPMPSWPATAKLQLLETIQQETQVNLAHEDRLRTGPRWS